MATHRLNMSPPRFYQLQLPQSGVFDLDATEAHHATQVLRLAVGAEIVLFDGCGGEAVARLTQVSKRSATAEIVTRMDTDRELQKPLELLVALPKGDRQKTLIDGLVQYGTSQLTPLLTERGVAQPTGNALERLRRSVVESSKQCGRNRLMSIASPRSIAELTASALEPTTVSLVAHPYGPSRKLSEIAREIDSMTAARVVIGPEGGLTDAELSHLASADWTTVQLGPRMLRIEYAAHQVAAWWSAIV